jgi:hypothetical protein
MEQAVPPPPPIPNRWSAKTGGYFRPKEWTMARYNEVSRLPPTDAAYIAGLIDGEGTITLTQEHANESRRLVVSISNTEYALLEYVKHVCAAGRITNKRISQPHHTPSFAYKISNRQALALLEQIYPFLRSYKADRAALVLREYVNLTPRNGKYTDALRQARDAFEQEFLRLLPKKESPIRGRRLTTAFSGISKI